MVEGKVLRIFDFVIPIFPSKPRKLKRKFNLKTFTCICKLRKLSGFETPVIQLYQNSEI